MHSKDVFRTLSKIKVFLEKFYLHHRSDPKYASDFNFDNFDFIENSPSRNSRNIFRCYSAIKVHCLKLEKRAFSETISSKNS